MTDLSIGGETFNVLIEGDAALPVAMLSHALGADLHLWDDQMSELLKHFRVLRYDTRGHGGNGAQTAPYDIARLGHDALAILDALDIDKVHWIGMSKGGLIGQWLMINAPERIERAVLANTMAHGGDANGWNARIVAAKHHGLAVLAEGTMSRWFSDTFLQDEADRVASAKTTFLATSAESYAAACAALRDVDLREDLRRIAHPVLIIAGRDDASVSPAQTASLIDGIENAQLLTLEARHISNIEAADAFNAAVIDFLTAKAARPSRKPSAQTPLPMARRAAGRRSPATRGGGAEGTTRRPPPSPPAKSTTAKAPAGKTATTKTAAQKRPTPKPGVMAPAKASTASARMKQAPPKAAARSQAAPRQVAKATAKPGRRGGVTPKTLIQPTAKTAPKPVARNAASKTAAAAKASSVAKTSKTKTSKTKSLTAKLLTAKAPVKKAAVKTAPAKVARPPAPKSSPAAKVSPHKVSAHKVSAGQVSVGKGSAGKVSSSATQTTRSARTTKTGAAAKTAARGPASRKTAASVPATSKTAPTKTRSAPAKSKAGAAAAKSANRMPAAKAPSQATSRRK